MGIYGWLRITGFSKFWSLIQPTTVLGEIISETALADTFSYTFHLEPYTLQLTLSVNTAAGNSQTHVISELCSI